MRLSLGDAGEDVKTLQRGLNKLGSLLVVDGHFGNGTREAVVEACPALGIAPRTEADDELFQRLASCPELSPDLGSPGATFIARAEISDAASYRQRFSRPAWPSPKSGITIGVGYDLQFVSPEQLQTDWGTRLPADARTRLAVACLVVGSASLVSSLHDIDVPLLAALPVYTSVSLPRTISETVAIYPQLGDLTFARRSALVSLAYNRGNSLVDRDPILQERREMRASRDLLAAGNFDAVADQFDAMARLWTPALPGVVRRRHDEATLWRSGFAALQLD